MVKWRLLGRSLEVFRGCMRSAETVLRGLVKVLEVLRGFMGSQSSKFFHFCNPCDLHVFKGPTFAEGCATFCHRAPSDGLKVELGVPKKS